MIGITLLPSLLDAGGPLTVNFAGEEAREASKAVFNDPRKNGCHWFYGTKRKLARRMLGGGKGDLLPA